MIRRSLLAAVALTLIGGVAAPAIADTVNSGTHNNVVCVLGTNASQGIRDGLCVWFPGAQ
jgi:hypothetical protein